MKLNIIVNNRSYSEIRRHIEQKNRIYNSRNVSLLNFLPTIHHFQEHIYGFKHTRQLINSNILHITIGQIRVMPSCQLVNYYICLIKKI